MSQVGRVVLLPERRRFAGQSLSPAVAGMLGRADRSEAAGGELAQLQRHFRIAPPGWPLAAIGRQAAFGDAGPDLWLRADPAFVRPEISGVRLMGWGNLSLQPAEAGSFIAALAPVFEDAGMRLLSLSADSWLLRLPADVPLPLFAAPTEALGGSLLDHLPPGEEGRLWRRLSNETQVLLHHHPANATRVSAGKLPVNSLWFWAGGTLPERVDGQFSRVETDDADLRALASMAGAGAGRGSDAPVLEDRRQERDWASVETDCIAPALQSAGGRTQWLDFADGALFALSRRQGWRRWRRPLRALDA